MTDRDRLIELIYIGLDGHNNLSIATMRPLPHYLADGILADGWIRPPCKEEIKRLRAEIERLKAENEELQFHIDSISH